MYRHSISLLDFLILLAILICVGLYFYPKAGTDAQAERREQGQVALVKLVRAMHIYKQKNGTYAGAAGSEAEPQIEGSPPKYLVRGRKLIIVCALPLQTSWDSRSARCRSGNR